MDSTVENLKDKSLKDKDLIEDKNKTSERQKIRDLKDKREKDLKDGLLLNENIFWSFWKLRESSQVGLVSLKCRNIQIIEQIVLSRHGCCESCIKL